MTGRCLCGQTTYIGKGAPSAAHACSCDDCRRFCGSAFIGVDFEALEVSGPVKWFNSSDWGERGSCGECGSALFWRLRRGDGPKVVTIGSLDDASKIAPVDKHYFADNMPPAYDYTHKSNRMSREETLALFASFGLDE